MKKLIALLLAVGLLVAGLALLGGGGGVAAADSVRAAADGRVQDPQAGTDSKAAALDDLGSESYGDYAAGVVDIELGEHTVISGDGASVEGGTVRLTAAGVYHLSGTLAAGCIEVDAKGKVYLEFDGVDITSSSGPALCVTDAKKVVISLVEGTTNSLADTNTGSEDTATLLTNDTLLINGKGTLIVVGNNNEAISSDDDIIINSGTLRVTAVDDGLNAHDDITINGGDIAVYGGGDGLDSNGTINIKAGTLVSFGGTGAVDSGIDASGAFTIQGGTIIAGGNAVTPVASGSKQCTMWVASESIRPAGTSVLLSRDGGEIVSFTPEVAYRVLLISSADLVAGAAYQAYLGGDTGVTVVAAR